MIAFNDIAFSDVPLETVHASSCHIPAGGKNRFPGVNTGYELTKADHLRFGDQLFTVSNMLLSHYSRNFPPPDTTDTSRATAVSFSMYRRHPSDAPDSCFRDSLHLVPDHFFNVRFLRFTTA